MARLLGNPGILGQGGYMTVHPGIIPGWPCYLGILGYLDKGVYDCPSWDNPGILGQGGYMTVHPGIIPGWPGYPGYLDKGGRAYGCPSWDNPGIVVLCI